MADTQVTAATHRNVEALGALVGGTPLIELHYRFKGAPRRIYAK